jgi:hypothetical protein
MNPHEMRQLNLQYSFPFKFFELLQFGAQQILGSSTSFQNVFDRIKELNLFTASRLYLKAAKGYPDQDQFANYLVNLIEQSDYKQIHFKGLIEDYKFPADRYDLSEMALYWRSTPRYIDPELMHQVIQKALILHISETAEIYQFGNPTHPEKYGLVRIWEDLQHYLCIDHERKLIQVVTSGFD